MREQAWPEVRSADEMAEALMVVSIAANGCCGAAMGAAVTMGIDALTANDWAAIESICEGVALEAAAEVDVFWAVDDDDDDDDEDDAPGKRTDELSRLLAFV